MIYRHISRPPYKGLAPIMLVEENQGALFRGHILHLTSHLMGYKVNHQSNWASKILTLKINCNTVYNMFMATPFLVVTDCDAYERSVPVKCGGILVVMTFILSRHVSPIKLMLKSLL